MLHHLPTYNSNLMPTYLTYLWIASMDISECARRKPILRLNCTFLGRTTRHGQAYTGRKLGE